MTTLAEFLLARIAEDETNARRYLELFPEGDMAPLFRRVLAECDANRRIVEHCSATARCGGYEPPGSEFRADYERRIAEFGDSAKHLPDAYSPYCDGCSAAQSVSSSDAWVLKHMATVYADRPDYQEAWKP